MKITIIYDNTVWGEGLKADWGFAALVETKTRKILFDTGASGAILLSNMQKLAIAPEQIEDVFISHAHFDHTGGLSAFLDRNNTVKAWVPHSFRGLKRAAEVIPVDASRQLYEGIHSTGQLEGIEQSLCLQTRRGVLVIAGCSHPRLEHIFAAAGQFGRVFGIIGGLHGNRPEALAGLEMICATHCTRYKEEIRSLYPDQWITGGVGSVIEIAE